MYSLLVLIQQALSESGGIMPATAALPAGHSVAEEELAPLSLLLALARDLHIFLLEALKEHKKD